MIKQKKKIENCLQPFIINRRSTISESYTLKIFTFIFQVVRKSVKLSVFCINILRIPAILVELFHVLNYTLEYS